MLRRRAPLLWLAVLWAVALALVSPAALAAGTVRAEKTTLQEADGRWRLKLTVDYGSVPDITFVPMIFDFEPVTYFERALTDESGEKPVITKKPLQNMKHINESMEVGFSDGTGKAFKVTKFDFSIRRDRGFEAGEYKLIVKLADSGKQIGQPIRLVLEGDNPIVDRRSITFVGEKPGKDKKKGDDGGSAGGGGEKKGGDSAPSGEGSDGGDGSSSMGEGPTGEGGEPPPPVEPKQGGCGCLVAGHGPGGDGSLALLAALAVLRRRRAG